MNAIIMSHLIYQFSDPIKVLLRELLEFHAERAVRLEGVRRSGARAANRRGRCCGARGASSRR